MDDEKKLKDVKALVKSLVVSSTKSLSVGDLCADFRNEIGDNLPLFGFKDAYTFLRSISDTVILRDNFVVPVTSERSQHIELLISRQRSPKKKKRNQAKRRGRGFPQQFRNGTKPNQGDIAAINNCFHQKNTSHARQGSAKIKPKTLYEPDKKQNILHPHVKQISEVNTPNFPQTTSTTLQQSKNQARAAKSKRSKENRNLRKKGRFPERNQRGQEYRVRFASYPQIDRNKQLDNRIAQLRSAIQRSRSRMDDYGGWADINRTYAGFNQPWLCWNSYNNYDHSGVPISNHRSWSDDPDVNNFNNPNGYFYSYRPPYHEPWSNGYYLEPWIHTDNNYNYNNGGRYFPTF